MDCSVHKEINMLLQVGHVLHMGHFLLLMQHTFLEPIFFHLILQIGGTYVVMGRKSHDNTLLHKLTDSHVVYGILT